MKITLYIPGLPFDGNTINHGRSLGGSETMGYYVANGLAKRGHKIQCFCNAPQISAIDDVEYIPIGQVSQETPYGDNFQKHALNIPTDVIVAQRAAGIFNANYASKLNYFWTHDLALKRYAPHINGMMWNVNKVLGVSQFHVNQVRRIYGINKNYIDFIPNGVDLDMCQPGDLEEKKKSKIMLYSSRPERGLINLVGEGGIMEQLYKIDPEIQLIVVGYDNTTPQSAPLYQSLWQRCQILPNVRNYGFLSKQELAELMKKVWLHIYPTEFEEVSCITAMEQQAAGTPFLTTKTAALPETLDNAGVFWSELNQFTNAVLMLRDKPSKYDALYNRAVEKSKEYGLDNTINKLENLIEKDFNRFSTNKEKLFQHFIYNSDIAAANELNAKHNLGHSQFLADNYLTLGRELSETSDFYAEMANYHIKQDDTHGLGAYQQTLNIPRVRPLVNDVAQLPPGSRVLDYGCCVGHVTTALAVTFPDLIFEGCDIDEKQIEIGNDFIKKNGLNNVSLFQCVEPSNLDPEKYDAIICGEVLEHIWDYKKFLTDIEKSIKYGGKCFLSTPCGPWEALSFDRYPYKRQHLHQFEYADIEEILATKTGKEILYVNHPDQNGDKFGFYLWSWKRAENQDGFEFIDYERKTRQQNPRDKVSACLITRSNCGTIHKTLQSIAGFVDEFIIAVDANTLAGNLEDSLTYKSAAQFPNVTIFANNSPLEIGFEEARNATISKAKHDWILWIDDDEIWTWADKVKPYLKDNHFKAYAIPQHHFGAEPVGVSKTDLPCRLFRNFRGIRFYGVVHEHPENGLNKGTGETYIFNDQTASIMHVGYENEAVRRARFQRNWPLMIKDKQKYPERFLGRALTIRDLDHLNRFEFEQTRQITPQMLERCKEILEGWRHLIELRQSRFALDSLPYISDTVNFMTQGQGGYSFQFGIAVNKMNLLPNQQPNMVAGKVENKEDLKALMNLLADDNLAIFENDGQYL
jgi:glycosyltransferase involved in cell wall biosynthesis/2-polyprenyl-3-methyl-5-hydroxy-6-metoxy-1,4-benzoquinol methylase